MQFLTVCREQPVSTREGFFQVFQKLEGSWRLERRISDGSVLEGTATFAKKGSRSYLLHEQGDLVRNAQIFQATRTWIWDVDEAGNLEIRFDEPGYRLYHRLELNEREKAWCCEAEHICGRDRYVGEYRISPRLIVSTQRISGPNKNISIKSFYRRTG